MPTLQTGDERGARLLPFEVAVASGDRLVRFKAHALAAAVALVPASLAVFIGVNRRHEVHEGIALTSEPLAFSPADEWRRYLRHLQADDPFLGLDVHGSGATVALLGDLDADRSAGFRDYLRQLGLVDRADLYVRDAGALVASIALVRSDRLGPFTARDVAALRRVQALIEHAYACAEPPDVALRGTLLASGLSHREADVAALVGRGATNAEIARSLHLRETTIKTHVSHVYEKLDVQTRTQLALLIGGAPPAMQRMS